MDRARNREHLAALVCRGAGGDERARLQRRLHHQGALRQRRHDAIAFGKIGRQRPRAQQELAEHQAVLGNAPQQGAMPLGVDLLQPRADHRDRAARRTGRAPQHRASQRALMRSRVHATCQARHHRHPGFTERPGKGMRVVRPLRGGVTAAHHGHRGRLQQTQSPLREQQQRRIGNIQQARRIVRIRQGEQMVPALAIGRGRGRRQPSHRGGALRLQIGGNLRQRRGLARRDQARPSLGARLPHRLGRPQTAQQSPRGHRADVGRQHQTQPGAQLFPLHMCLSECDNAGPPRLATQCHPALGRPCPFGRCLARASSDPVFTPIGAVTQDLKAA